MSLTGYLRGRRLSEAAKRLMQGAPDILGVALDAGYGSHEAFTRAFRQQFGCTPEQLRAQAHATGIPLQESIRIDMKAAMQLDKPRLVRQDALLIFGLAQRCPQVGDAGIPSLWNRFVPYLGQIAGQIGNAAYGVIYNGDDSGTYDYIAGAAVREFPDHPAEFTRL